MSELALPHGDKGGDLPTSRDVIHTTMQAFAVLLDSVTGASALKGP
ncbi:hypothetical protein ACFTXM_42005 [Streptomyces sp. NPDC056930]